MIVLLFTGFPAAFAAIMTTLHVPLSLMLIGIVLRGSAFTFRSYDNTPIGRERWNRLFAVPSVVTPVLLGAVIGAIATGEPGRAAAGPGPLPLFSLWIRPFPIVVGLFALNIFAYLAAVYLTLETSDPDLSNDFRVRALCSAVVLGRPGMVGLSTGPHRCDAGFPGPRRLGLGPASALRHRRLRDHGAPQPLVPRLSYCPGGGDGPGGAHPLGLRPGSISHARASRDRHHQQRRAAHCAQAPAGSAGGGSRCTLALSLLLSSGCSRAIRFGGWGSAADSSRT